MADAEPQGQALTARVRPFSDPQRLRVVVVVTWPRDPADATADDVPAAPPVTIPGTDVGGEDG